MQNPKDSTLCQELMRLELLYHSRKNIQLRKKQIRRNRGRLEKMKQNKWRHLKFERYIFGLLLAIELIMAFTFLGFIHIDPISLTTAYIPIVVAGCLLGPLESTIIGLVFGLASMYKASALYVVSDDRIFSPLYSGNPVGSILLSVGARFLFGFLIGYLFSIIRGRKYERVGIWILSLLSQWLHAFLVYSVMGVCFPKLGYNGSSTFHMGINDALIAVFCLFWVEAAYTIYHSERIQKYKDAVNQSWDNPYLSRKMVGISAGISLLVMCMAILSTGYFAERSEYMLKQHRIQVTRIIEFDLLHLQIQFLIAMLALDFILILTMLMIYRYMKYREYQGEIDSLTGVMGRRLFLHHCESIQNDQKVHGHQGWFLFLDVDWFKQINDNLGHIVGDETLKKFAMFLKEQFEAYGVVGRVGGDEFAVMIEKEMSQEELEKELEKFLQSIAGILTEVTVSCSIGVYRFKFPKTIKELMTRTDEVLYEAKANGRGCFVIR